jgi:ATP-dependent helicase HrpA
MAIQFMNMGTEKDLREQFVAATLARTCMMDPLPRTAAEFEARREQARARIALVAQEFARLAAQILGEYAQLQKKLAAANKGFPAIVADVQAQCAALLGKNFIVDTPFERLQHFPRYLKAAALRLDKARADAARDARNLAEWQALAKPWQRENAARAKAGVGDAFLDEFRWLLEELRVALFAQELRTPTPVSVKRLQKTWESRLHG